MRRLLAVFTTHRIFFLIFVAAALLRLTQISSLMIFIGDQGRDFAVAREMVTRGEIPLLGIPSSVPRFAQGPLYIYILALVYWISSGSMLAAGITAAVIGLAGVVAVYVFCYSYLPRRLALMATFLLAFFPMMILHSRMPYHINPIPLAVVIYLWQLVRLCTKEPGSAFGVAVAFALVFQFELAAFPLLLLIPLALYLRSEFPPRRSTLISLFAGLGIGLLPQLLHDLTHQFSQLGGFMLWVMYKIITALVPFTSHSLTDRSTPAKISELLALFGSVFSQNSIALDRIVWLGLMFLSASACIWYWRQKRLTPAISLATAGFWLLIIGFFLHRVPSEAYMPLLAPLGAIVLAHWWLCLSRWPRRLLLGLWFCSLAASAVVLQQQSYFLLTSGESDWTAKRFGPALSTQREVIRTLSILSGDRCITLDSMERRSTFPTLYAHLEYQLSLHPSTLKNEPCAVFLVDRPTYAKRHWLQGGQIHDLGAYWVVQVKAASLYAKH